VQCVDARGIAGCCSTFAGRPWRLFLEVAVCGGIVLGDDHDQDGLGGFHGLYGLYGLDGLDGPDGPGDLGGRCGRCGLESNREDSYSDSQCCDGNSYKVLRGAGSHRRRSRLRCSDLSASAPCLLVKCVVATAWWAGRYQRSVYDGIQHESRIPEKRVPRKRVYCVFGPSGFLISSVHYVSICRCASQRRMIIPRQLRELWWHRHHAKSLFQ
jgi:hypothetical protein